MAEIVGTNEQFWNPDNFSGAGPAESVVQFADSCTRAGEGDFAEIGLNAGAMGLDLLGMALDPLGSLATAGIGWLIEHVDFLREPLDKVAGNPDKIKQAVATWNQVAIKLDDVGSEQDQALSSQVRSWEEAAADAFRKSHGELGKEMRAMGSACTAVSAEITTAGTMVATVRGMIRDLISQFVFEVIRNAAIALAGSAVTFGGAAAAFAAWTVGRGAMVLGKITQKLAKLMQVIMRVLGRLKGLFSKLGDLVKGLKRFGRGGSGAPASVSSPHRTRSAGASGSTPDTPAATRPSGSDPAPNSGVGQRMEDWGKNKVDASSPKAKEAVDAYKDAGNQWKRDYEDKWKDKLPGWVTKGEGAVERYTPFKPKEAADGTVSAHSRPDGALPTKLSGDLLRETAKADELGNEVTAGDKLSPHQEEKVKERGAQRVEQLRGRG